MKSSSRLVIGLTVLMSCAGFAGAQFLETFDDRELRVDPAGIDGWSFFSGDGQAMMDFVATGEGHASILVDATRDHRNVWWALIKRRVSEGMDLERLGQPGWELRVEARVRSSHAPRRINLHVNTQRTTDFHSHLMEFDIPDAGTWHTISMTTRDFPVEPGDTVFGQMALMDWGRDRYELDVDYFKVDVVEAERAGPDLGEPLPYHPPVPDPGSFEHAVPATEGEVVDLANPEVNLGEWSALDGGDRTRVLTVGGAMWVILRWDLEAFEGRRVSGHGLLQVTTHSVQRNAQEIKDFGLLRVVEIHGGAPAWRGDTVTLESLLQGEPVAEVVNPQPIIDWPVSEGAGATTLLTITRPVLQRLVDGTTTGLALTPLGSIVASFATRNGDAPRLLFNIENRPGGE
jgi:hypothetical protein